MRSLLRALPAVVLLLAACGSGAGPSPRGGSNVISPAEVEQSAALNAYQLVQSLRPEWLRQRGMQSLSESTHTRAVGAGRNASGDVSENANVYIPNAGQPQVIVYLGTARLGDLKSLEQIPLNQVGSIEFMEPARATLRYGGGHTHGAIVVTPR